MPCTECVSLAFLRLRETAYTALASQGGKFVFASGKYFVGICLMTHIPHYSVPRNIKNLVQSKRKLNCSKVRRQMSALTGNVPYEKLSDFTGKTFQFCNIQFFQIFRRAYFIQNTHLNTILYLLNLKSVITFATLKTIKLLYFMATLLPIAFPPTVSAATVAVITRLIKKLLIPGKLATI